MDFSNHIKLMEFLTQWKNEPIQSDESRLYGSNSCHTVIKSFDSGFKCYHKKASLIFCRFTFSVLFLKVSFQLYLNLISLYCLVLVWIHYDTLNARQLKEKSTKLKPKVLSYKVTCNINPTIAIQRGKVHAYATHTMSHRPSFFSFLISFCSPTNIITYTECGKSPNVVRILCTIEFWLCGCYQRDAIILFAFSAASHLYYNIMTSTAYSITTTAATNNH